MKVITRMALMAVLGEERRSVVHDAEHHEMEFGTHWRWNGAGPVYTAAALRLLADACFTAGDKPGALLCRAEAEKLDNATALEIQPRAEVVTARGPVRSEPGEDEFLARRWDLREANS